MEKLQQNSPGNKCPQSIASNCVPYNGNKITCIPTCTTDSVSDVLYKLGQKECFLESKFDFTNLDLSCFYSPCPSCNAPTELIDILQIMVNYMCAQATRITTLENQVAVLNAGS